LLLAQFLGALAVDDMVQLGDEMLEAPDDLLEARCLVPEFEMRAHQRGDSFALVLRDGGQIDLESGGNGWRLSGGRPDRPPNPPSESFRRGRHPGLDRLHFAPVEPGEERLELRPVQVIAHWLKASVQALEDLPQLRGIIDGELRHGLSLAEDAQLLTGNGTAPNLTGLVSNAAAFSDPLGASSPTKVYTVASAILQVSLRNYNASAVVLHPSDAWAIRPLRDSAGWAMMADPTKDEALRLFGLPVVATAAMTQGDFLVGDFTEAAVLFDRWQPRVEVGFVSDDFTKNLVTVRAEERVALAIRQPMAMVTGSF
jgi:hypothetical protein